MKVLPDISVIVPVYNCENTIIRCIDSVLLQSYTNFELILIDDGSTDSSGQICDSYQDRDIRIKVIHQKNYGVSTARNQGILIAQGKYITFIDSDDYIEGDFFSIAYNKMVTNNFQLYISSLVLETYKCGQIIKRINYYGIEQEYYSKNLLEALIVDYPLICISGPCCKLYDSDIINKNNLIFDTNLSLGEDTDFNIKYLKHTNKIYFSAKIFYHYTQGERDSLTSKYYLNTYENITKIFDQMRELFIYKKCSAESIVRFESLYFTLLIGCIINAFRDDSNNIRLETINKVSKNRYIRNLEYRNLDIKRKIFLLLLRLNAYRLIGFFIIIKLILKKSHGTLSTDSL